MNKESLARVVASYLDLPYEGRQGKAYEIIKVLLNVIIKGLQSGHSVKIDGFGIFTTRLRPATRHGYDPRPFKAPRGAYVEVGSFGPTLRVIFKPSKPLKRFINS